MKIKIIAAIADNGAIGGEGNTIPWSFHPEDMKIFLEKTKSEGALVVMGRKTFLSLPEKVRPLPARTNIVLTRNQDWMYEGAVVFTSKESLLAAFPLEQEGSLWICGGAEVYIEFLDIAEELHISHFRVSPEGAVAFFPSIDHTVWKEIKSEVHLQSKSSPQFTHKVYVKN